MAAFEATSLIGSHFFKVLLQIDLFVENLTIFSEFSLPFRKKI